MDGEVGYIYIREHEAYNNYAVCKLGKTECIPERENTYITGEIVKGVFTLVFEVKKDQLDLIEKVLQENFKNINVYINGGTEFFKLEIKELIEPYFKEKNIYYKLLSQEDIGSLKRKYREKKQKEIGIQEPENILQEENAEYNKYLQQIKINYLEIKDVPKNFITFELCIEAIKKLDYISYSKNYNYFDHILRFIPDNIKNYDFWLECVKVKCIYLWKVPENFIDYNLIFTALKTDGINLDYKIENFKSVELCIDAVRNNMGYLHFLSDKILNYNLCLEAVKYNSANLKYVPNKFKSYELYFSAIKNHSEQYKNEYNDCKINTDFHNTDFYSFIDESIKNNCEILKIIPEEFKTYELCLKIVKNLLRCYTKQYPSINKFIPKKLKSNYSFNIELGKRYPITLINHYYYKNETYLEIVKYNGSALYIVPPEQRTYEICLEAVKAYGFAIEYVPEELLTLELCLIAIKEGSTVLSFIPEKFKTDELCFEAVKIGGEYALKCLPVQFKTKKFYEKCIEYDNKLAQYIPKKFKIK